MKKILILCERFPFPPISGTKSLLYNYCRIICEELHMSVVCVSFTEPGDDRFQKPRFIEKLYELPDPSTKSKLVNLIIETLLKRRLPIQVSLFWDKKIKKRIDDIINKEKPDFVIADLVRTAEYLRDYLGFKIIDMQDLFSLRYERQLQTDVSTLNPYGSYLNRIPRWISGILKMNIVKKRIMRFEMVLLKKYEMDIGNIYDKVMFVAQNEGEQYNKALGMDKAMIVPMGVDYNFFSNKLNSISIPNSIAFMGALSVAHNESGIIHFIKNIFPSILNKIPDAKLYIVGGGATEKLKKLASDKIFLMGMIDDVRTIVGACEVFICPLQFGSGIKTKNIEAMAMGIPVVTTVIGAENISAKNGIDWFVVEDDDQFAEAVCKVMTNAKIRSTVGTNGQKYVKGNFTWNSAKRAFDDLFSINQGEYTS